MESNTLSRPQRGGFSLNFGTLGELGLLEAARVPTGDVEEMLELRSKLIVTQQELERREHEAQEYAQRMQLLEAERASLQARADETATDSSSHRQLANSRNEVMGVNLETNGQVVEKLIELNSELMDAVNVATVNKSKSEGAGLPRHPTPAKDDPLPPPSYPPPSSFTSAAPLTPPPTSNGIYHHQGTAHTSMTGAYQPPAASVPSAAPQPRPAPPQASLSEAFSSFLTDPDPPTRATAADLALPIDSGAGGNRRPQNQKGGQGGGGLMGMLKWVAGTPPPASQQSQHSKPAQNGSSPSSVHSSGANQLPV
eukprot:gene19878-26579_t